MRGWLGCDGGLWKWGLMGTGQTGSSTWCPRIHGKELGGWWDVLLCKLEDRKLEKEE